MRTILVADDRRDRNLGIARHAALIVGFAQECIHAFHDELRDARRLSHPDRRAEDQDVGGEDPLADMRPVLADMRPVVAFAFIRRDAPFDVVRGDEIGPSTLTPAASKCSARTASIASAEVLRPPVESEQLMALAVSGAAMTCPLRVEAPAQESRGAALEFPRAP